MGMFDEITCKYPLSVEGANDLVFQTKDTDAQFLDLYEMNYPNTKDVWVSWLVDSPQLATPPHIFV